MEPNPLLRDWKTPFGVPPFKEIGDDDFGSAFEAAFASALSKVEAIASDRSEPDFANTVEALEQADEKLGRVCGVFFNLAASDSNEKRRELEREIGPKLAEFSSQVFMNEALYDRVKAIWDKRDSLCLDPEQARMLELYRRDFVRAGAELRGADRDRFRDIKKRLASLGAEFSQNLLSDESSWHLELSADELEGLPEFAIAAAKQAAADIGSDGHAITLNRSHIVPFLQYSTKRALREKANKAWRSRGSNGGQTDNRRIAAEMLALRSEMAVLLGYRSYAEFKLEKEMAKSPAEVRDFLLAVWGPASALAERDAEALAGMLSQDGEAGSLEPWDWRFYAERRRKREHSIDEAETKQYFQLDRMIEAAFDCASRLFGLGFEPLECGLYHPECRAWEVRQGERHIAVFIGDYFARASKRSGAWSSTFRSQRRLGGDVRPIAVNVCNFVKPPEGDPCLLSFDDARTLFHEFGHALHSMLSDVTYERISGTSVARDFVELPSQLFEHWLETPEVLSKFAVHAKTGQPIPAGLIERLLAARNFDQGFSTVEYLASALVDLEVHDGPPSEDAVAAQSEVLERIGMPPAIRMRHAVPHFAHVFSGDGYAAGYYSYLWSEMMDADAFEFFLESGGPFDSAAADGLRRNILSAGGSKPPEELYEAFRGRLPGVGAVLRKRGLPQA